MSTPRHGVRLTNDMTPQRLPSCAAILALALGLSLSACAASAEEQDETVASEADELSVGVFAECALPGPARGLLAKVLGKLHGLGIEVGVEAIIAYDHDLVTGADTVEVLFGGVLAGNFAKAMKVPSTILGDLGVHGGLLGTVTMTLDGEKQGQLRYGLVAYGGGDVYAAAGGRWKTLWSTDQAYVGGAGYWASVTAASAGACKGGAVMFVGDHEVADGWRRLRGSFIGR